MAENRYGSPWLTRKEAAAYCRCGEQRIRSAVQCGEVPAYRGPSLGGDGRSDSRLLLNRDDLDHWIRLGLYETPVAACI